MKQHYRLTIMLLTGVFVAAAAGLQARELYRWTDENGVVHFSDQKPVGVQDFETTQLPDTAPAMVPETPPDADPVAAPAGEEPGSVAQQRREEIARHAQEARQAQAERDAQCAAWRDELERLEPSRRVYFTNEQGETERMDDVARVDRVAELKQEIAANCR